MRPLRAMIKRLLLRNVLVLALRYICCMYSYIRTVNIYNLHHLRVQLIP